MKPIFALAIALGLAACTSSKPSLELLERKLDVRFELRQEVIEVYGGVFLAQEGALAKTAFCMAADEARLFEAKGVRFVGGSALKHYFSSGDYEGAAAYTNVDFVFKPVFRTGTARLVDIPGPADRSAQLFDDGVWTLNESFAGEREVFDLETLLRECREVA